ncbi:MAG: TonB-dependent receptor [Sphingobacteriia bacterium]|nr:TonB-dependent receptor [Sphingobacteriia bacterium]
MVKQILKQAALLLMLLFFSLNAVYAQTGEVTGVVRDADDGSTIPGVSIVVKGTLQGTTTDIDGRFRLVVGANTTLVFSFVGYGTTEVVVQPNTSINVDLKIEATALEELIVIGYGVQKKEDATGSVIAVDAKEFNKGQIMNPAKLVSGKIAGVQIIDGGGAPGEGATIRIRGGSSLSASNDPLYVIDGVPIDNEGISGSRYTLNSINPADIETFTVLKDASATAIYGSRASNGVIMITTKKGKTGKPLQVEYNGTFSMSTPVKTIDVLGAKEFSDLVTEMYPNQAGMLGTANTDWQDEIYQNALGMDHLVSLSGAYKFLPYRLSLGYSDQDGILETDNFKRTTINANLNPKFLDDHLSVNVNVKYANEKNQFANRDAIGAAIQYDPTKPVTNTTIYNPYYLNDVNDDGVADTILMPPTDFGGYYAWIQSNGTDIPVEQGSSNPVALLKLKDDHSDVNRLIGNLQMDYKFHFLPELRANLNLGYDYSKSSGEVIQPDYAPWVYDALNGGGIFNYYEQEKKNELLDFYLNYNKDFEKIESNVDAMIGYSWQHFWRADSSLNGNYSREFTIDPVRPGVYQKNFSGEPKQTYNIVPNYVPTENYLVSFFGRVNYTFKNRYLLTFTLRNDGTSRFSPDTRWGLFPSAAFAWKILDENFMKNVDVLSQLKLRLGWGVTGQQNINQGDYPYLPRYTRSNQFARYQLGNLFYYTMRPAGYDYNIKWEETTTSNIGLDFGFAQDRFYGSIDYYKRKTEDLINFIPVPAGTNLSNFILTNVGNLENEGIEFSLTSRIVNTSDLFWEAGFNATYNKNEITKLTATDDPDYPGVETGGISGGVGNFIQMNSVGYPSNSFFVFEQVYDIDGMPIQGMYVDRNGDGEITDADRYHYKKPAADFYFGISSALTYKNWDFSFSGRANFGNYAYNNIASENAVYERLYRPEGPYLGNIISAVSNTGFVNPQYRSDYYIQDASFFRMDNITLSYLFPNIINGKTSLRVSATVTNAFVITRYDGIDPEISNGIDNRLYPRPRTYVLGVNLQF